MVDLSDAVWCFCFVMFLRIPLFSRKLICLIKFVAISCLRHRTKEMKPTLFTKQSAFHYFTLGILNLLMLIFHYISLGISLHIVKRSPLDTTRTEHCCLPPFFWWPLPITVSYSIYLRGVIIQYILDDLKTCYVLQNPLEYYIII